MHAGTRPLIACRDALESALCVGAAGGDGPYAEPARALIRARETSLRHVLSRYDELAAKASNVQLVLTHGEPHPGNTMLTADGWLLIDWDTTMISLPERDLCNLDPGDGSVLDAYQRRTGLTPRQDLLEFFRLRWDLTDIALAAARFSEPHGESADDQETFALLAKLLQHYAL
jgi:aminoglycoside phosphotransferase (APT) family kinase protein